jgi:hypothetical protein
MNDWEIPAHLEALVKKRDRYCVYCHVKMKDYPHRKGTPRDKSTWEHIDNNGPAAEWNIVRCCAACNSSKGTKKLSEWLKSEYCVKKGISTKNISNKIVKKYISKKFRA